MHGVDLAAGLSQTRLIICRSREEATHQLYVQALHVAGIRRLPGSKRTKRLRKKQQKAAAFLFEQLVLLGIIQIHLPKEYAGVKLCTSSGRFYSSSSMRDVDTK